MPKPRDWVLLAYRMPREPSTARVAVWRRLRKLGVVQLVDGLVALPADDRTIEQLEWIAERVVEGNGEAMVWIAHPRSKLDDARLRATLEPVSVKEGR